MPLTGRLPREGTQGVVKHIDDLANTILHLLHRIAMNKERVKYLHGFNRRNGIGERAIFRNNGATGLSFHQPPRKLEQSFHAGGILCV